MEKQLKTGEIENAKMDESEPKKAKEERKKKEKNRLTKQFGQIDKKKKAVVQGLIERAAFMRVELEDIEADIQANGYTEKFSQGNQKPYDRLRPAANMYNSLETNYQKIISQLTGLLPKDVQKKEDTDGFEDFVNGRED